jgi:toxin YoeB
MNLLWTKIGWEDYLYWQENNKKIVKKINNLISEIRRIPFEGTGKPEPLKFEFAGKWSRRIDGEHRLIYDISTAEIKGKDKVFKRVILMIYSCRYHY